MNGVSAMPLKKKSSGKLGRRRPTKQLKQKKQIVLVRSRRNPVLVSNRENDWESGQTFNPAALYVDEKVHILYRALGEDGVTIQTSISNFFKAFSSG